MLGMMDLLNLLKDDYLFYLYCRIPQESFRLLADTFFFYFDFKGIA